MVGRSVVATYFGIGYRGKAIEYGIATRSELEAISRGWQEWKNAPGSVSCFTHFEGLARRALALSPAQNEDSARVTIELGGFVCVVSGRAFWIPNDGWVRENDGCAGMCKTSYDTHVKI